MTAAKTGADAGQPHERDPGGVSANSGLGSSDDDMRRFVGVTHRVRFGLRTARFSVAVLEDTDVPIDPSV